MTAGELLKLLQSADPQCEVAVYDEQRCYKIIDAQITKKADWAPAFDKGPGNEVALVVLPDDTRPSKP